MKIFRPADVLLPNVDSMEKWAVIACDQFSSQPEYWKEIREEVGDAPSTLHMILPEAELGQSGEQEKIRRINRTMRDYIDQEIFKEYPDSFIYIERTLQSGKVRKGLIGMVDLEAYSYEEGADSAIRATEKTVTSRIPPRMRIREGAALEKMLIELIGVMKSGLLRLYEFDLMNEGKHITGWLVQGDVKDAFELRLHAYERSLEDKYMDIKGVPMTFAVGDGNHSLATAKACYEALKKNSPRKNYSHHPARYALVELENIHSSALEFEPIHRILTGVDPEELLERLRTECGARDVESECAPGDGKSEDEADRTEQASGATGRTHRIEWYSGDRSGVVYLDAGKSSLAAGVLQPFLDSYLKTAGGEIDYIHGDDVLKKLAGQKQSIGFLLPAMEKGQLFRGVMQDGVLPRKTFSMGHACDKRYYLEGRRLDG